MKHTIIRPLMKAITRNSTNYASRVEQSLGSIWLDAEKSSLKLNTNGLNTKCLANENLGSIRTLWNDLLKILGIRPKLNPSSFIDKNIKRPAKIYTICTDEGAKISKTYRKYGVLYYDEKIPDGFRDAGRDAVFGSNGKVINSVREIITVDKELDKYLINAINYAKDNTKTMNEEQKLKFLYKMLLDICGNAEASTKRSDILAEKYRNSEILLGDIFAKKATCCRHKSLMFKILAEEVGLNTKMIRGDMKDLFDEGGHIWNEVKLSNGKKFLVDTQNSKLINLSSPSKFNKNNLQSYYYKDRQVY